MTLTFFQSITATQVVDIFTVFFIVYGFLYFIKNSRTYNLLKVIVISFAIYTLSLFFDLKTLHWMLEKFAIIFIILGIIIFQPELRAAFEKIRRGHFFTPIFFKATDKSPAVIKQILTAVDNLSKQKVGALIVLEAKTNLSEYIESGIPISGSLSSELLINLFWPHTPTHDGAVIIHDNKILAAGCLLPLSQSKVLDRRLGTRHRAAIGISEVSDAFVIVISEETGTISIVEYGVMTRFLNREGLETRLFDMYKEPPPKEKSLFQRFNKHKKDITP